MNVQVNLMVQNLLQLPSKKYVDKLRIFGILTSTTAHANYSTLELRRHLGFPLHKLSVFVSPEQYYWRDYSEKENLMVVSPDNHHRKAEILNLLNQGLPSLQIQIIRNLTYEEYKETISRAKWSLTFGEGLDGYFVEPVFSGGISFSVYNSSFFTSDFKELPTVYESYDALVHKIIGDVVSLDNAEFFIDYQKKQFSLCQKYYDYRVYVKNLEAFYKKDFTFK
jgi:hypothetical protein